MKIAIVGLGGSYADYISARVASQESYPVQLLGPPLALRPVETRSLHSPPILNCEANADRPCRR